MKAIISQALVLTPIATTLASNGTDHVPRTVRPRRRRHVSKTRRTHASVIKPIQTKKQGVSSVLVVRAIASDAQTTLSEEILFERIFGDTLRTLSSVYNDCSSRWYELELTKGTIVVKGIVTVNISTTQIIGQLTLTVASEIKAATIKTVGNLSQWDHVIYCLPPGTSLYGSWEAYGEMLSSNVVLNDEWCGIVSVVAHELGHNMGLEHSDENNKSYDDQSCIMGLSYNETGSPAM